MLLALTGTGRDLTEVVGTGVALGFVGNTGTALGFTEVFTVVGAGAGVALGFAGANFPNGKNRQYTRS